MIIYLIQTSCCLTTLKIEKKFREGVSIHHFFSFGDWQRTLVLNLEKYTSLFLFSHWATGYYWACRSVWSKNCRAEDRRGGGQLCNSWGSAQQPGGSCAFTSQLPVLLSHIVPFRAQTVYSPCSGHPTIVRASWFEKAWRFFFWVGGFKQVKAICICFSLKVFTGQLRQEDIERAKESFPHHPSSFRLFV